MDTEPLQIAGVPNTHPLQLILRAVFCVCLLVPVVVCADQPKPFGDVADVSTSEWTFVDGQTDEFNGDTVDLEKEKAKWDANGWKWNQAKLESNFTEIDENQDGIASGLERKNWFARKK